MKVAHQSSIVINGFFWSFIENISRQISVFVIGIILARLLEPSEFGLIGLLTIVIALSQTIIDSGLTQALIRKKECTELDYSTVFNFNLILSFILYCIVFTVAPWIAVFFKEPKLVLLTRVLGIGLILGSFSIIQRVKLSRDLNFKHQTKVALIATFISGVIAIIMAYKGYGVWSLVARILIELFMISLLLTIYNKWTPSLRFSRAIFLELFGYSNKLLASSLLDTLSKNIYNIVIAKNFSMVELGYYTKAEQFQKIPTMNLTAVVQRVSFPFLSKFQDDPFKFKNAIRKIIKHTMFISFSVTLGLAAISESLILTTIGSQWRQSVMFLQLLCLAGMFYPMHAVNLNVLNVLGHSDKFLKIEVVKKVMLIPIILLGIGIGMKAMLYGIIINSILMLFVNGYYAKKLVDYSIVEQLRDVMRSFIISVLISIFLYVLGIIMEQSCTYILLTQLFSGVVLTVVVSEIFKIPEYLFIRSTLFERLKTINISN